MKARTVARILGTAVLGLIAAAGGCADRSTGAPIASPAADPSGTLAWSPDPEIVPGDTHYLLDVVQEGSTTYQTTTPVIDPLTGASMTTWTVAHETETQRVEAGYDALGRAIQVLQETTPLYDPMERAVNLSRRTRSVENVISSYGPDGALLQTDHGTVQSARGIVPSYAQITDGVVLDAEALDTVSVLTADATALAPTAGPRARARRAAGDRIEVVNELTPDVFGPRTARGAAMLGTRGSFVRTWRRQGGSYLLERTELVSEWDEERGVRKTERQVNQIRVVRLHRNPRRDAERRTRRGGMGTVDDVRLRSIGETPGDNCVVGQECPPDDPPPPPPPPATECLPVPGGAHLLYQHGIKSDGGSFFQMRSWLACAVSWERMQSPSIDWRRRITQQRDELRAAVAPGMRDMVLIGHSNGGLVTRSLAQWAQVNQPGLVKGVITLDSPNQGALVAHNLAVASLLLSPAVIGAATLGIMDYNPYVVDDMPNSAFLRNLNGFSETFVNVGIQTHTPKRWVAWRILLTGECLPRSACEAEVARRAQKRYDDMRHTSRFLYRPWHAIPAAAEARALNGFDATWNKLTAPGNHKSDGFIHDTGQYYPRARQNQLIPNGDSHTGTTTSDLVRIEVVRTLEDSRTFGIRHHP
ncbi:hypothetical protein [Longimicrobium terrae]|uniref:Pimeloyl-ACP methyl ester carboxylesterase n=1 Tax=Longimicrobium terrae TaxID=1639882 RepID=A0A841GX26_9BACT|nr:hypothetical protein [Longimicrobium terrae]MBB4634871.1 pimeloyl-ACP methyl ester carboxylesterase [Longimicrobium terrae]MBB6069266.1 pimeloyl-ACP methyl ester carboxylesterase [Longimicrobium terrae]NNC31925.1 hypothetical protein [Longimicrobium terrae]